MMQDYAFVSCDIVGHSAEPDLERQVDRIRDLNEIVDGTLNASPADSVVWASGGDGGHVAIGHPDWLNCALDLISRLRRWSNAAGVRLRIVAHYGAVSSIKGAGGYTQLVGSGINLAGRLLEYGDQDRVVVSRQFVEAAASFGVTNIRFHDSRFVQLKHFSLQSILLLSLENEFESNWASSLTSDRRLLAEAVNQQRYWDVVYYARRLMDVDLNDQDALQALIALPENALTYKEGASSRNRANPLLGHLDSYSCADFIKSSQLVERERDEILFYTGDAGNTMFIILRGEVAVIPQSANDDIAPPTIQIGVGEIVGELAYALHRKRTATLQCLTRTTLLSFSPGAVEMVAEKRGTIREAMTRFVKLRILEHVCNNVDFLVGKDRAGPLCNLRDPWVLLADEATLLEFRPATRRRLSRRDSEVREPGLYILTSGELRESGRGGVDLDGTSLPVIFAELPGTDLVSSRTFDIVTPVTVLRIGAEAFASNFISRPVFEKLLNTVRNSIHNQNTKPKPPRREIAGPIRVLFLAANPVTTGRLRIDQEAREIEEKLQRSGERDKIELITRWAVRFEDLQRCLLEFKPHIVHFSGHGTNENELIVEDRTGAPRVLEQETLLELFDALRNNIRVVILNACYSVAQATAITGVIDCAIGMTNKIGDQAAIAFATSFYQALAYGETIATAHRLGNLALKREAKQKDAEAVLVKAEGIDVAQITIVG